MEFSTTIDIDATPARVWEVMSDIERWPEWTDSVNRAERVGGDSPRKGFGVDSVVRLAQPRLPEMDWTVTDWSPGHGFTWTSSAAGLVTEAVHEIEPLGGGDRCTVSLKVRQRGPMSPVIGLFGRRRTRKYLEMESRGLKARAERGSGG